MWLAEALGYHAKVGELDRPFALLFCEMQKLTQVDETEGLLAEVSSERSSNFGILCVTRNLRD